MNNINVNVEIENLVITLPGESSPMGPVCERMDLSGNMEDDIVSAIADVLEYVAEMREAQPSCVCDCCGEDEEIEIPEFLRHISLTDDELEHMPAEPFVGSCHIVLPKGMSIDDVPPEVIRAIIMNDIAKHVQSDNAPCEQFIPVMELKSDFNEMDETVRFQQQMASAIELAREKGVAFADEAMRPILDDLWKKHVLAAWDYPEGEEDAVAAAIGINLGATPYTFMERLGKRYQSQSDVSDSGTPWYVDMDWVEKMSNMVAPAEDEPVHQNYPCCGIPGAPGFGTVHVALD